MTYYVYILANRKRGTLYTGVTNDLSRRIAEHREGRGATFPAQHGCTKLVWFARCESIDAAISHEKRVKKWRRAWKEAEIEKTNPEWRDLFSDMGGWTG